MICHLNSSLDKFDHLQLHCLLSTTKFNISQLLVLLLQSAAAATQDEAHLSRGSESQHRRMTLVEHQQRNHQFWPNAFSLLLSSQLKAQGVNDQTSRKVCSNGHDDDGEDIENLHVLGIRVAWKIEMIIYSLLQIYCLSISYDYLGTFLAGVGKINSEMPSNADYCRQFLLRKSVCSNLHASWKWPSAAWMNVINFYGLSHSSSLRSQILSDFP